MSYLLGDKTYMESLAADVQDIQAIVTEVISRVGPVPAKSWKFPGKQASDLDIEDLLDLYDYDEDSDDPEAKQIAHIALYELVIDRLVFLVQAVSRFCGTLVNMGMFKPLHALDGDLKMAGSVGIIIKQFWICLLRLHSQNQQLSQQRMNNSTEVNSKLDTNLSESVFGTSTATESSCRIPIPPPVKGTPGTLGLIPPNNTDLILLGKSHPFSETSAGIAKDTSSKACQTFETAFTPCDSCDVIQRRLRESGDTIVKVCTEQGLPSSLRKFKAEVSHVERLSFNDICRWMSDQNKDIERIAKQNEILQATINPLKDNVNAFEKRTKSAEEKIHVIEKNMKEEIDTRLNLCKQYENKLKDKDKLFQQLKEEEERQKRELDQNKQSLENEMTEVKQELETQKCLLRDFEASHRKLAEDLAEKKKEAEKASELAREVTDLKSKLADITLTLENHSKSLIKEQGKSRSTSRHNESLQAKQETLMARMELLVKENEDLSRLTATLEEEKMALENSLLELKVEAKSLRKTVKENKIIILNLEKDKLELEKSMKETEASVKALEKELKKAKERELMILEYPDLNGPISQDLQGTGDVAQDMDNQVKANVIRIQLLEEQNQRLLQSIHRLSAVRSGSAKQLSPLTQLPLWHTDMTSWAGHGNNTSVVTENEDHSPNEFSNSKREASNHRNFESPDQVKPPKQTQYAWSLTKRDNHLITNLREPDFSAVQEEFLVTRGNTPQSTQRIEDSFHRQGRPSSAKLGTIKAPVNASAIGAYIKMKKSLGSALVADPSLNGRPPSGKQFRKTATSAYIGLQQGKHFPS